MNAYLIDGVRSPRGKGKPGGALSHVPPLTLLTEVIEALAARTGLEPSLVDDVRIGCAAPSGEQGSDIARLAAILAGYEGAGGATITRLCCSGLDAVASAACAVASPMESVIVAGGVESMSRVPMFSDRGPWFSDPDVAERTGFIHMAVAADLLASLEGFERPELDGLAARSQRRAAEARDSGYFKSLVPVAGVVRDELIREDLDEATLAERPGAFAELADDDARRRIAARYPDVVLRSLHHARSSPGLADAASALLVADEAGVERLGRAPRARVVAYAHASVEPTLMLHGNVDAVRLALSRAGWTAGDVDLFEVNESFAVVPLHFARELEVSHDRLNIDGGAIAMGHPLGATGGVLLTSLMDGLERTGGRRGVASVCGGAGVATAIAIERCG